MTDASLRDRLISAADDLDRLIDAMTRRITAALPDADPFDATDQHGQPLLAAPVVARADVLAALAHLDEVNR